MLKLVRKNRGVGYLHICFLRAEGKMHLCSEKPGSLNPGCLLHSKNTKSLLLPTKTAIPDVNPKKQQPNTDCGLFSVSVL